LAMNEVVKHVLPPPPGWGADSLTGFMETAYRNRFATFANKSDRFRRLVDLDACFVRVATEWLNPPNMVSPLLFLRSHAAYRAACEHAASGQVAETFPEIRACIEWAAYALYISKTPGAAERWLRRHDATAMKSVKSEFKISSIRSTIERSNPHAAKVFNKLYQQSIDFGAHPNERAVTSSLTIKSLSDCKILEQLYLHGDGLRLEHVLRTTAQTGVCALEILQEAVPARFEILGVRAELLQLRKGL
jgi:hypothetical protein